MCGKSTRVKTFGNNILNQILKKEDTYKNYAPQNDGIAFYREIGRDNKCAANLHV